MEQNIKDALEVYVDRPLGVFVDKLERPRDMERRDICRAPAMVAEV